MTDAEILTLVDRLERCLLSNAEFHHRDHITVAVVYLYGADFAAALDRMRASLCRFVAYHGGTRYHESLTRFWMAQVEKHLDRSLCLEESVRRVTGILADKNLPRRYYSEEKLASCAAKQGWLEPDLMSL
jgi:hypothetical protein